MPKPKRKKGVSIVEQLPVSLETFTAGEIINRELGWLEFNRRVLAEAQDERTPLLERLRFMSIVSSNLDEFFMKRVGGLKRQLAAGVLYRSPDGLTPTDQLAVIRERVEPLILEQAKCFSDRLKPLLGENGILLLDWKDLKESEKETANKYFDTNIHPVLTPLAVDPGHPFPFLSNLSTSWGVTLKYPDGEEKLFARVKVPNMLSQWIPLELKEQLRFVRLHDVICHNLQKLFPNMVILSQMLFRVTRNADIERDEEDAEDLLEMIEDELRRRRFAKVVRLQHGKDPDPWMLQFLMNELELKEQDVYLLPEELDYTSLKTLADLNIPNLKFDSWVPTVPPLLQDEETNIFSIIRNGDLLVHHPYESFSGSVERFVRSAVEDKKVLAIKMTLYRTGDDSPFIPLLIRASEAGKQVICLVELKAYFDEERNIIWAQALERAGVHVVYGVVGLKTHAKTILVVREETDGILSYAHIGTGNYHAQTSRAYTDVGLFTCKKEITTDVVDLFHFLTGRSLKKDYQRLLVAPINMKERFISLIQKEIENHQQGLPSGIRVKVNSFEDQQLTRELYKASVAGVKIELLVRGFCVLVPGVAGLSENIKVISVVGRFLEHSRMFYFRGGAEDPVDGEFYIGSADWMYRNLHSRVEVITPILERSLKEKCHEIFQVMLNDERQVWEMQSDGRYLRREVTTADGGIGAQNRLMQLSKMRSVTVS
jgi:polyphosphate kinase